jgi:uracil-DNA glycosylase
VSSIQFRWQSNTDYWLPAFMSDSIAAFGARLAETAVPPHVYNPYSSEQPANAVRRHNLGRYLRQMQPRQPRLLLVAEAPGYRGCRLTGVPFSSPHIMQHGLDEVDLYGPQRGYQLADEWPHIRREASATIVWETLRRYDHLPLLWNAFPFHPHRPGNPQSNRPPKISELALGQPFVESLLTLFPIQAIIAVGNKAETALARWGFNFVKVRHPSQGGKRDFQQGLAAIL